MSYHHILVAVDLTEECDPVIHRARELSVSNGAKLSLVHIVKPMATASEGDVSMELSLLQQQQFDQARERLALLINKYPEPTKESSHMTYGQPHNEKHPPDRQQARNITSV
ncbi:universal stress protein, partial [Pseudomonas sp. MWU13-2860]